MLRPPSDQEGVSTLEGADCGCKCEDWSSIFVMTLVMVMVAAAVGIYPQSLGIRYVTQPLLVGSFSALPSIATVPSITKGAPTTTPPLPSSSRVYGAMVWFPTASSNRDVPSRAIPLSTVRVCVQGRHNQLRIRNLCINRRP